MCQCLLDVYILSRTTHHWVGVSPTCRHVYVLLKVLVDAALQLVDVLAHIQGRERGRASLTSNTTGTVHEHLHIARAHTQAHVHTGTHTHTDTHARAHINTNKHSMATKILYSVNEWVSLVSYICVSRFSLLSLSLARALSACVRLSLYLPLHIHTHIHSLPRLQNAHCPSHIPNAGTEGRRGKKPCCVHGNARTEGRRGTKPPVQPCCVHGKQHIIPSLPFFKKLPKNLDLTCVSAGPAPLQ